MMMIHYKVKIILCIKCQNILSLLNLINKGKMMMMMHYKIRTILRVFNQEKNSTNQTS